MSSKTDLRVVLGVDGEAKFTATMKNLEAQQKAIKSETKNATSALSENAKEYEKAGIKADGLTKQIAAQQKKVLELKTAYEKSIETKGKDDKTTLDLQTRYNNADTSLNNMKNSLAKCNKVIDEHNDKTTKAAEKIEKFGTSAKKAGEKTTAVGKEMTKYLTASIVTAGAVAATQAVKFEDAFAGVIKTVDGTNEQLNKLKNEILDMSTTLPISANEIAKVAEAAGQLGIKVDDISAFTKVMIELGMSTNLSAEDAATMLAKFANITKMSTKDYEKLGSTIVDLGNNYATTELDIIEMATRLAATGETVGYNEAQILAVATALSSVGIEAEAGGSAFSKMMKILEVAVKTSKTANDTISKTGMDLRELELLANHHSADFKNVAVSLGMTTTELKNMMSNKKSLEQFADVAGVTSDEFVKAYGVDAVSALGKFIDGLKNTSKTGKSSVEILQDMGLEEVRLSNAVLSLSQSDGILNKTLETANNAWAKNTALQTEVAKRLATTKSKMELAKNELAKTAIIMGDNFLPAISKIAKSVGNLAEKFGKLNPETQQSIVKFALLAAGAGPVVGILGKITSGVGGTAKAVSTLIKTTSAIKKGTYTGPLQTALNLITKNSSATANLAGSSTKLAGIIGASGPLVIGLVAAAGAAAGLYAGYQKLTEGDRAVTESVQKICSAFGNWDESVNNATNLLSGLNSEIFTNSEASSKISSQVDSVQMDITKIATTAAIERRTLTDVEIKRLEELFTKLNELSNQELEYQQAYQDAAISIAQSTVDYSKENCSSLIKTAEDAKNGTLELAKGQLAEKLILLQRAYADEKTITTEEYEKKKVEAQADYDLAINSANEKFAKTYEITTQGYFNQNIAANENMQRVFDINQKFTENENNYNNRLKEIANDQTMTEAQRQQENTIAWWNFYWEKQGIQKEIAGAMNELNAEELATWIEMSANTEGFGGKISAENQSIADNFMSAYDNMPKKAKKAFSDTMNGMLAGIAEKSGELYKKASEIAGGFIQKMREKFEINSPSKVMIKIFGGVIEGGVKGIDKNKKLLILSAGKLADEFTDKFSGINVDLGSKISSSLENLKNSTIKTQIDFAKGEAIDLKKAASNSDTSNFYYDTKSENNNQTTVGSLIKIENLTVRNDNDIRSLVKQIEAVQKNIKIGKGKW